MTWSLEFLIFINQYLINLTASQIHGNYFHIVTMITLNLIVLLTAESRPRWKNGRTATKMKGIFLRPLIPVRKSFISFLVTYHITKHSTMHEVIMNKNSVKNCKLLILFQFANMRSQKTCGNLTYDQDKLAIQSLSTPRHYRQPYCWLNENFLNFNLSIKVFVRDHCSFSSLSHFMGLGSYSEVRAQT